MRICPNCHAIDDEQAAYCRVCGSRLPPVIKGGGVRRFVTVVRCDLVNSSVVANRYDPEFLRRIIVRYLDVARQALERHGGTLERFVGDEVVALYGLPARREDDALRACQAAVDLRDRLVELNAELLSETGAEILARIGVESGEVAISTGPNREMFMVGDVMSLVTRLEQAAEPGAILIGGTVWRLVRSLVDAEPVGDLSLKGQPRPVPAYRLHGVASLAEGQPYGPEVPIVGREGDHDLLSSVYKRAARTRSCHLVTVTGLAGIGKTRLLAEFARTLEGQALVLTTRCPQFGGAAYGPIVDLIQKAAGLDVSEPALARAKLVDLVGPDPSAARVTERIEQILGLHHGTGPTEDVHWAIRRLLELLAGSKPLVVVIDDLHQAEAGLLDAIQEIAESSRNVPLLIVGLARPELLDHGWHRAGVANSFTFQLAGLDEEATHQLVVKLLDAPATDGIPEYVVERSGGNPLFVRMLVAILREEGLLRRVEGVWRASTDLWSARTPLDVRAVVGGRLGRLRPEERNILGLASVIGKQFSAAEIRALAPDADPLGVEVTLRSLSRKGLITPGAPITLALPRRSEGYAFHHNLVQEVAYEEIARERRAELHERYADWVGDLDGTPQLDELVGHHLEQAYRHVAGVGGMDDRARRLARRAAEVLAPAGHRTALRGDIPDDAVTLLTRALTLLPDNDALRRQVLFDLADARCRTGDTSEGEELYHQLNEAAEAASDQRDLARAQLGLLELQHLWKRPDPLQSGPEDLERALQIFEEVGDLVGRSRTWRLLAYERWGRGKLSLAQKASEHAISLARRANNERLEAQAVSVHCFIMFWSETPVDDVASYTRQAFEWAAGRGIKALQADALRVTARVRAMQNRLSEAQALLDQARAILALPGDRPRELRALIRYSGDLLVWLGDHLSAGIVALLADDPYAAEQVLRRCHEALGRMNDPRRRGNLTAVVSLLARALLMQGRDEEVEGLTRECELLAAPGDVDGQVKWRTMRAVVLSRRGEFEPAERLASEAEALMDGWEQIDSAAEVRADLALVARNAGDAERAAAHARQALAGYERKGNVVGAARVSAFLSDLTTG